MISFVKSSLKIPTNFSGISSNNRSMVNIPGAEAVVDYTNVTDLPLQDSPASSSLTESHPDLEYYNDFNEFVSEFFSLAYLHRPQTKSRSPDHLYLQPSKITLHASYYRQLLSSHHNDSDPGPSKDLDPEQQENDSSSDSSSDESPTDPYDLLPGAYWTSEEKDIFFNCLARYSIHRAEEFLPHLQAKSTTDILAYYTLLKEELKQASFKTFIEDEQGSGRVPVMIFPNGTRYSDFPIAYEVDDGFSEYEENQSIELSKTEQSAMSRKVSKKRHLLNHHLSSTDAESEEGGLIDYDEMTKLASIYRSNQLFPILAGRKSCRLEFESYLLLEKLVELRTREILGNILAKKTVVFDPYNELSSCIYGARTGICAADIWKATLDLCLFETSWGERTRHRDGKYPFNEQYWQRMACSLNLNVKASHLLLENPSSSLTAFQPFNHTTSPKDQFLHSPTVEFANEVEFVDFSLIESGARGSVVEHEPSSQLVKHSRITSAEISSNGYERGEENSHASTTEQDSNNDSHIPVIAESSAAPIPKVALDLSAIVPNLNNSTSARSIVLNTLCLDTDQVSHSFELKDSKSIRRTLEDFNFEDRLIILEEMNLDLLDRIRDIKYLRTLRKRLKLSIDDGRDAPDFNRIYREGKIVDNLNELWDRAYSLY